MPTPSLDAAELAQNITHRAPLQQLDTRTRPLEVLPLPLVADLS
jgi:hypothetical protein